MLRTPGVNTNPHDIADKAKYEYVRVTERLAAMHDRLTELADTGLLDVDESSNLQNELGDIWENVCEATIFAVLPDGVDFEEEYDTLAEDCNTYSDGRTVVTRIRIEPRPHSAPNSARNQENNRFLNLGEAGDEGVICYVAQPNAADDQFVDDAPQQPTL